MNAHLTSPYRRFTFYALAAVVVISVGVLVGWVFDIDSFKKAINRSVAMNPVTAVGFFSISVSILLSAFYTGRDKLSIFLAAVAVTIGLARLLEIIMNHDVGVSELLFSARLHEGSLAGERNTIAPNTAACFLLCGLAVLLNVFERRWMSMVGNWLALVCLLAAMFSLVGYLYYAPEFYNVRSYIPMAFPTAVCFFLVALSLLTLTSENGLFSIFLSPFEGSRIARFLLPFALLIPIATGKIRLYGESNGLYSSRFGTSLFAMVSVILFSLLIWRSAILINRSGRKLRTEMNRSGELAEKLYKEQIKAYELTLLQEKLKQNRLLAEATIDAQEKEKKQIGMELHDHINQILASTKMYIDMAKSDEELRDTLLDKSTEQLTFAISEIRKLSKSMVLHTTEASGIYHQILEMTDNIARSTGIEFSVKIDETSISSLGSKQQVAIYRILEEQLNNIIKYAASRTVTIRLWQDESDVHLAIEDDGVGFDVNSRRGGIGLSNISSRAEWLGGTMNIESAPGKGCRLFVNFPVAGSPDIV